jgi:hypothetical protein
VKIVFGFGWLGKARMASQTPPAIIRMPKTPNQTVEEPNPQQLITSPSMNIITDKQPIPVIPSGSSFLLTL